MSRRPKNPDTASYTGKYYLTNATLLPEVIKCRKAGKISNELAKMLMLLTERYSKSSKFGGYTFREDMVSEALINLCQNALKFNPEKSSNPFAFYTTSIHHSFLQFLNNEKKHRNIRDKMLIELGENPSFNYMTENKNSQNLSSDNIGLAETDHIHEEILAVKDEIVEAKERKMVSDARELEEKLAEEKLLLDSEDDIISNDMIDDVVEESIPVKSKKKQFFKFETE